MLPKPEPRRRVAPALFALALIAPGATAWAQDSADPSGVWLTESGTSKVRIARCGTGYCGTLVSTVGAGLDTNNPDASLKGRKLLGVQILDARTPSTGGFEGSLYNPQDGKTYSGSLTPKGLDRVEVAGCVLSVICKRQTWTRVK